MSEFAARRSWGPAPKYPKVKSYLRPCQEFIVIAGPCSVENPEQIKTIAKIVAADGATHLRGGLYRAGTYPGENFGLVGRELLQAFRDAASENGLRSIIEVLDVRILPEILPYADCLQVGCRQMQNYSLLRAVGATGKQVFLKRHPGSTIDEWLGSAEHLLTGGVCEPVLIERGSSTHMNHVRWDLSISAIAAVQELTDIPVICDASHGTGRRDLVKPMALAGVAAGADGLLLEVHTDPEKSLSDADQAIHPKAFKDIMNSVHTIREAFGYEW